MTTLADIAAAAGEVGLCPRGALRLDNDPEWGTGTVVLIGPDEPGFWAGFAAAPEYADGAADPLDRWSKRVLTGLAADFDARVVFPSDGPPYPPFLRWAVDSGQSWLAPPGLLVHAKAGLLISFRGALILRDHLELPPASTSPCDSCADRPCATACPVGALGSGAAYDVPLCAEHVRSKAGRLCREQGCRVRQACPVSAGLQRLAAQSGFHMSAFLGSRL